jgi:hypothetical protein
MNLFSNRPSCARRAVPRWDEGSGVHSRRARQNERLFRSPKYILSILRVDYFAHDRQVNGAFLRRQPQDAAVFVRHDQAIGLKFPYPLADVGDALGLFKPGFTFL